MTSIVSNGDDLPPAVSKNGLKRLKSHSLTQPTATPNSEPELPHPEPPVEEEEEAFTWEYLEHNGVFFPPLWVPHLTPVIFRGEKVSLTPAQEEMATYWAQTIGTDWETKPFYLKNFSEAWLASFGAEGPVGTAMPPAKLEDFDFSLIKEHVKAEKEKKELLTPDDKAHLKLERERVDNKYKLAIVDDRIEKVANFRIEPPTLFKGRGEHPKAGFLKQRTFPEDIEINAARNSVTPICHLPGRAWGDVSFKNDAIWLASYSEEVTGNKKYVQLGATSLFKTKNDIKKYERARRLKVEIERIRASYRKMMASDSTKDKQLGTATYFIDFLAIRAGNEKKEDEADTVGCCSLRKEHISLLPNNEITLDFLGKDSMRYLNTVTIDPQAHKNLDLFLKNKEPRKEVFDLIDSSRLNDYLHSLMEDLTAKVFRTFNASNTLQNELSKSSASISEKDSVETKIDFYNKANRSVAVLCNHQKGVTKTAEESLEKARAALQELKTQLAKEKKDPKRSKQLKEKIQKAERALETRESNKAIALGTSKLNYNDPRISVAWCKRFEVPIEKVFTSVLLEKFRWAMDTNSDWQF
jgi:DNA topoisomerase-1